MSIVLQYSSVSCLINVRDKLTDAGIVASIKPETDSTAYERFSSLSVRRCSERPPRRDCVEDLEYSTTAL